MVGSMLMLAAILYLVWTHTKARRLPRRFDYLALSARSCCRSTPQLLLLLRLRARVRPSRCRCSRSTPGCPTRTSQAPTGGSVILAAVLLKLGTYGYIRFCMGMFPAARAGLRARRSPASRSSAASSTARSCAWKQDDVKHLVAYSSVATSGFVMLGLFAGDPGGHARARSCRWSTTASRPARSSSWSA